MASPKDMSSRRTKDMSSRRPKDEATRVPAPNGYLQYRSDAYASAPVHRAKRREKRVCDVAKQRRVPIWGGAAHMPNHRTTTYKAFISGGHKRPEGIKGFWALTEGQLRPTAHGPLLDSHGCSGRPSMPMMPPARNQTKEI